MMTADELISEAADRITSAVFLEYQHNRAAATITWETAEILLRRAEKLIRREK